MPEPEYPNHTRPDPLLGSGAFIDADQSGSPEYQQHQQAGGFESMPVIDATPISMVAPEDFVAEPAPKATKRRNMEEMAKRPSWLPEDWRIDLRVRSSGASTGVIDRYFFDPSGRKFRSKHEVLHFLETGNKKLKRNADDVHVLLNLFHLTPLEAFREQKIENDKQHKKKKKSKAFGVDAAHPLDIMNNVQANSPQRT